MLLGLRNVARDGSFDELARGWGKFKLSDSSPDMILIDDELVLAVFVIRW